MGIRLDDKLAIQQIGTNWCIEYSVCECVLQRLFVNLIGTMDIHSVKYLHSESIISPTFSRIVLLRALIFLFSQ